MIPVGVIGCGSIARFHFQGLAELGVPVRWVCDLDEQAGRARAEEFGARYTADYREVLADEEVRAVDVLTISSTHGEICTAAIEAGKAVICEKTLAENPDDALKMAQLAGQRGTVFYTSYMKRFIPAVAKAHELLGAIGRVTSAHVRAHQPWCVPWEDADGEHGNRAVVPDPATGKSLIRRRYGGGILVCGGSHILDLVCYLLGRPKRVFATMHTPSGADVDILASAMLLTDEAPVHFEAMAHSLRRVGFLRDGWDERLEINGTEGRLDIYSAAWDQFDRKASLLVHYNDATGQATEYRYPPCSPFTRALAFFLGNIAEGRQGGQSRLTGYYVDELIAHIQRSAAQGKALDVLWRV